MATGRRASRAIGRLPAAKDVVVRLQEKVSAARESGWSGERREREVDVGRLSAQIYLRSDVLRFEVSEG